MSDDQVNLTVLISHDLWEQLYNAGQSKELYEAKTAEQMARDILFEWGSRQNAKSQ